MTYAVIFTAEIAELDEEYLRRAQRLRELALEKYGCRAFTSCREGNREIAVSYWDSEEQIRAWKQDREHLVAQQAGQEKWYARYCVEIVKIKRAYGPD